MDKEKLKEFLSKIEKNNKLDKFLAVNYGILLGAVITMFVLGAWSILFLVILIPWLGISFGLYTWKYQPFEREFVELAKKELGE